MRPREILTAFDRYPADRGLRFDAVVIGGAALNLLDVVSRPTKDRDILHPALPVAIVDAARAFAAEARASGTALELRCLGREDLLRSKRFALCDRGIDLGDCLGLAPTAEELRGLLPWLEQQDANPDWPAHVRATVGDITRRLGHGL